MNSNYTLSTLEYSDWELIFCGNIRWRPLKGKEPNRFHRFMQKLCFGVEWHKTGSKT